MNRFKIILLLIVPILAGAQSLIDLYNPYIPNKILQDEKLSKEVESNLQAYGTLDPDLLYIYITHLQLLHTSDITNPDSNLFSYLNARISKTVRLKRDWARNSKFVMIDTFEYSEVTREISTYYDSLKHINISLHYAKNHRHIDTNFANFIKYLFIRKEPKPYDPSVSYERLYAESVSSLIDFFESNYSTSTIPNPSRIKMLIRNAKEYSYLFKGSYLRTIPYKTKFQHYEFMYSTIKHSFKTSNGFIVSLPVELISNERTENFTFTDPMDFTNRYYYKFNIRRSAHANIGFQIKLKELVNPGSYLRFSIGYSMFNSTSDSFSDTTIFSGNRKIPGLFFEGDYIFSNQRNINTFALTSEITFPVFYFTKKLYAEAGIHYTYQRIQFDFDFTKPGTLVQPFTDDPQPFFDDQVEHVNKRYHILRPIISINYAVFKQIAFRMDYIVPKNIRLGIQYIYFL